MTAMFKHFEFSKDGDRLLIERNGQLFVLDNDALTFSLNSSFDAPPDYYFPVKKIRSIEPVKRNDCWQLKIASDTQSVLLFPESIEVVNELYEILNVEIDHLSLDPPALKTRIDRPDGCDWKLCHSANDETIFESYGRSPVRPLIAIGLFFGVPFALFLIFIWVAIPGRVETRLALMIMLGLPLAIFVGFAAYRIIREGRRITRYRFSDDEVEKATLHGTNKSKSQSFSVVPKVNITLVEKHNLSRAQIEQLDSENRIKALSSKFSRRDKARRFSLQFQFKGVDHKWAELAREEANWISTIISQSLKNFHIDKPANHSSFKNKAKLN